jgi:hypothetical protein
MNLKQYQIEANRTFPDLGSYERNLLHMQMGVHTEVGEFLDMLKKHIVYKKPLDVVNLQEEIADICWYLVNEDRIEGIIYDDSTTLYEHNGEFDSSLDALSLSMMLFMFNYSDGYHNLKLLSDLYAFSKALNLDFFKGLENNIAKLRVRFPEKFTTELANNRNLERERAELEK